MNTAPGLLPDLSVVIVNYRTRQMTLDCLASIYRTALNLEVIVIDNASGDGSPEAIRAEFPQTIVINNNDNRYFSAAYTQGVQLASADYVLAMNPDMVVQGDALAQLLRHMQTDSSIGAATTRMFYPDGRVQRNCCRLTPYDFLVLNYTFLGRLLPGRLRRLKAWLWYAEWDRGSGRDVEVLPGSCIIAPREVWRAVGGFDARMLMYFSDDYLSRMVRKLGRRTVYLLSDGIIHYEGASAKQVSAWALRMYMHDLLVYTRLVFGRRRQLILGMLILPTWAAQRIRAMLAPPAGSPPVPPVQTY